MIKITEKTNRRIRKREAMLEQISGAAARLFKTRGFESVTMELIATEADVSKRTLYKHFPSKDAVLAYMLEAELDRDMATFELKLSKESTFRDSVSALLEQSAAWCEAHPDYLLPYIRHKFATFDPAAERLSRGDIVQTWIMLIAQGQRIGELNTRQPTEQLAIYFHYLYFGALMRWITNPDLKLKNEFDAVVTLFIEGAKA